MNNLILFQVYRVVLVVVCLMLQFMDNVFMGLYFEVRLVVEIK